MSVDQASRRGATTAQLKADIDAGRTGGKVDQFDPGLSPLGTDDEAGGRPNSPEVIAQARVMERAGVAEIEAKKGAEHGRRFGLVVTMLVLLAAAVAAFVYYLSAL